jgi:5-methyltetrahydropteroyltriglutamate--homocysteine methyltransferase
MSQGAKAWLEQAQDDATLVAIRDMERAGIDIIADCEIRAGWLSPS